MVTTSGVSMEDFFLAAIPSGISVENFFGGREVGEKGRGASIP